MSAPSQDFPPAVYASLATVVACGFALAGAIEWWGVLVTLVAVYAVERIRGGRR